MNAWIFASLGPGNPTPSSVEEAVATLEGQCGWRDLILQDVFDAIGIEGRRVGFYDVPFQGSHAATELFINGKWMFFDPTFGTYFEGPDGGGPLSYAEARALGPDVVIKRSELPGWQQTFLDPNGIDPAAYAVYVDNLFQVPEDGPEFVIGEVNSLYFGYDVRYDDFVSTTPVESTGYRFTTVFDDDYVFEFTSYSDRFAPDGSLNSRFGYDDTHPAWVASWFIDYDQGNDFAWTKQISFVEPTMLFDLKVIYWDDGARTVYDNDQDRLFIWYQLNSYFDPNGHLASQTGYYDGGGWWHTAWLGDGSSYRDEFDAGGVFLSRDNSPQAALDVDVPCRPDIDAIPEGPSILTTVNRDGSTTYQITDLLDQYSFATQTAIYDSLGRQMSVDYNLDSGTRRYYSWDLEGNAAYERVIWDFDTSGRRVAVAYDQDDGTLVHYEYDVGNLRSYSRVKSYFDVLGRRQEVAYLADNGKIIHYEYDVSSASPYREVEAHFSSGGQRQSMTYRNDDRTMVNYYFDYQDNFDYSEIMTAFDEQGAKETVVYKMDDGGYQVYSWHGGVQSWQKYDPNWMVA